MIKWGKCIHLVRILGKKEDIPNNGIASDVFGNVSATWLRNTVSESRIVTSVRKKTVHELNVTTSVGQNLLKRSLHLFITW